MGIDYLVLYMRTGLGGVSWGKEQERESAKIELRGCRDFILGQLQKTIRLQLSLFTNYRNNYV